MPPIPIYSKSPINAAKAPDFPQTASGEKSQHQPDSNAPTTTAAAQAPTSPQQQRYPPTQPGAVPAVSPIAAPTAAAQNRHAPVQPTPTQALTGSHGPPPPQPGTFPVPHAGGAGAGATKKTISTLPPPPQAGESITAHPAVQTTPVPQPVPYPAQMNIPPPAIGTMSSAQRGTSTTTAFVAPAPTPLNSHPVALEHPPGYQQNVNALDFNAHQRAAHSAAETDRHRGRNSYDGDEGVWDSAKKLAQVAGEKLSAVESEVWRRINKD